MKIGILTFHWAHNYGAVLQAYALQEVLKNRGHDVEFVNYYTASMIRIYKWFNLKRLLQKNLLLDIKELFLIPPRRKRFLKFKEFTKVRLSLSPKQYEHSTYDLVIIGSDQVWNTKLTSGYSPMYWGMWRGKDGKAQIASYAASMEDNLNTEKIESILKLLPNFDFISVREKHIAQKLSPFTNKNIHIVIDPTLLINREEWLHLGTMRLLQENYVLLYQVRNDEKTVEIAKKIADKKGVRLVYLSARVDLLNSKETIGSGPEEFVSLFRHACFVVCTSFHGTVFSCIFHVPFYSVLLDDGKDNRVKNLLSEIKLEKRGISSYPEEVEENIDWKDVDKQISDLQQSSYKYLNTFC